MSDVITALTQDHSKVDTLFTTFASGAAGGDKRGTVDEIVRELSVHAAIEEQVLYPVVAEEVPGARRSSTRACRSISSSRNPSPWSSGSTLSLPSSTNWCTR